jgi:pimeloyl-ACP methyl ester carboxylesterase
MKHALFALTLALAGPAAVVGLAGPVAAQSQEKATVVLVHGAFAGSSSWNAVISDLQAKGYTVIAAANPLRSVKTDAEYLTALIASINGPVVLVGHSYGGEVISQASGANVKALVFVAGFAPEPGESAATLGARFPGGSLGSTLAPPVPLPDGRKDVYIDQSKYWQQFAADAPKDVAAQMAATQRPITQEALAEPAAGEQAWHRVPSWFIYGSQDKNIPPAVHAFMAKRASGREVVEVKGASHALMVSHPAEVAAMIEKAAQHP